MFNFKSQLLGAAAVLPIAAAGLFTSAGSAQAVSLTGSIGISGLSTIPNDGSAPANTTLSFQTVHTDFTSDDFSSFIPQLNSAAPISISTLNLKYLSTLSSTTLKKVAEYKVDAVTPFINFGTRTLGSTTAALTFDLDDTIITRTWNKKSGSSLAQSIFDQTFEGITGKFNFNGKTIATGGLNATLSGTANTYQLTLTADPVSTPEPTTMLGLGLVAAGMTVARRRKAVTA